MFAKLEADGAEIVQEPIQQPYGVRDLAVRDPAGNLIRIQELGSAQNASTRLSDPTVRSKTADPKLTEN